MIRELTAKTVLYLQPTGSYWRLSQDPSPAGLGPYPLDIVPRLSSGHFGAFDAAGLPGVLMPNGLIKHNYTTMSAFALGHWSLFLRTGAEIHRRHLLRVADYIVATGSRVGDEVRLLAEIPGSGHIGPMSAMYQGEAMSVLCRAFEATKDERYLEAARGCALALERPVRDGGVRGEIGESHLPWYEEDPTEPLRHILNGMIYTLWGLRDLELLTRDERATRLLREGVDAVVATLHRFDSGWWSWYDLPEQGEPYIASMMYHELHICQLEGLADQTGRVELRDRARRFRGYAGRLTNRCRAGTALAWVKLNGSQGYRERSRAESEAEA